MTPILRRSDSSIVPSPSAPPPPLTSTSPTPHLPLPSSSRQFSDASSYLSFWQSTISAWRTAEPQQADQCARILDHITNGLPVVPSPLPTDRQYPNTPIVRQHAAAVRAQLETHLAMGAVEPCSRSDITGVHPLHVVIKPDKPGKLRIVVDFSRNLNDLLSVPHMRHASSIDAAVAGSVLGCWYSKLDIKDAFHSFSIRPGHERYLGFEFEGSFYRYRRLPQGLNTAPELCELMLSVVSWELTRRGVTHVRYCDDILIIAPTRAACAAMTTTALSILDDFGFAVAHHKTVHSCQIIEFLGVEFNSISGTVACPPHRLAELSSLLSSVLVHGRRHIVRSILSLVGKLSFAAHVLPGARPFFRSLIDLTRGLPKRATVTLDASAHADLIYWRRHLGTWNGRQRWRSPTPIVIATDASLAGWGGLVVSSPVPLPAPLTVGCGTAGLWCERHPVSSSTDIAWAELFAVFYMAATIGPAAPNSTSPHALQPFFLSFVPFIQSPRITTSRSLHNTFPDTPTPMPMHCLAGCRCPHHYLLLMCDTVARYRRLR